MALPSTVSGGDSPGEPLLKTPPYPTSDVFPFSDFLVDAFWTDAPESVKPNIAQHEQSRHSKSVMDGIGLATT